MSPALETKPNDAYEQTREASKTCIHAHKFVALLLVSLHSSNEASRIRVRDPLASAKSRAAALEHRPAKPAVFIGLISEDARNAQDQCTRNMH
jgi:hypothetical protein